MTNISFCISTNGKRKKTTLATIQSIKNQNWNDNKYEIIISGDIDNFNDISDVILVNKKEEATTRKVSCLRNSAADIAKYDIIAFCDDDIILNDNWFITFKEYNENNSWKVLSNKVLLPDGTRYWDRSTLNPHVLVDYRHPEDDKSLYQSSAFFLVKKEVFSLVRWDETKLVFADKEGGIPEDVQYSYDLIKNNFKLSFNSKSIVWHSDDKYTQFNNITILKQVIRKEYKKIGEEPKFLDYCDQYLAIYKKYNLANEIILEEDLVSIVVPTYNDAQYLEESIKDLLKQSYKNIEIIIVNDGSTDNTKDILNKLQQNYKNIFIYNKNNGGTGSALNEGFKYVKGKYVTWVSSDDRKTYDMVEKLVKALKENPDVEYAVAAFYETVYKKIFRTFKPFPNNKGYIQSQDFLDSEFSGKIFIVDDWVDANFDYCKSGVSFMFTKRLKDECGEYLEKPGEDYYMSMLMGSKTRVAYIDEPLGSHVLRNDSLTVSTKNITNEIDKKTKEFISNKYKKWYLKNIPKIANFYWGSDKMSFMRYMTLISFKKMNPDWSIHLYVPKEVNFGKTWSNEIAIDNQQYSGNDYFDNLKNEIAIKIIKVDFSKTNVFEGSEAHRSDYLRWAILSSNGGFWFDMDILFIKPMTSIYFNNKNNENLDTLVSYDERHISSIGTKQMSIGVLMSSGKTNDFYKNIMNQAKKVLDYKNYENFGTLLFDRSNITNINYKSLFPNCNFENLNYEAFYLYDYLNLDKIYKKNILNDLINNPITVGIHWYGGAPLTLEYNNLINHLNYKNIDNTIAKAICHVLG